MAGGARGGAKRAGKAPALRFWPPCCAGSYLCPRAPSLPEGEEEKEEGGLVLLCFFLFL